MQERGIIESNEEFANCAKEFFPVFLQEQVIIEKPAAVKSLAFHNEDFFYNCVGDHIAILYQKCI